MHHILRDQNSRIGARRRRYARNMILVVADLTHLWQG
jgi:hypothetical protein